MANMVMTQAELDAMIASGEASLTPPPIETTTPAVIPTPEGMVPLSAMTKEESQNNKGDLVDNANTKDEVLDFTPMKPKEYKFPTLRPRRKTSKLDVAQIKRLGMIVDKIEDPNDASRARAVLNSGARLEDIEKTVKIFSYRGRVAQGNRKREEAARVAAQKRKNTFSVDKKKAKQKYAALAGDFQASLDNLDYLVDNFDDDYVGYGDSLTHNIGRVFDVSDPKQSQYRKRYGTLLPNFKELENMGASFTASEQTMLKNIMPQVDSGDTLYRADMVNFMEVLRNKIGGKLNALEDGDYRTGVLRDIVDRYDKTIHKAKSKFGKGFDENNEVDEEGNVVYATIEEEAGTSSPEGYVPEGTTKTVPAKKIEKKVLKFDGSNMSDLDALLGL